MLFLCVSSYNFLCFLSLSSEQGVTVWFYEPDSEHKLRVPGTVLDIIAGEMVTVQNITTLEHHTLPVKELKIRKDFVNVDDPKKFVDMDDMLAMRYVTFLLLSLMITRTILK